jgi:hypothetical protein
MPELTQAQIDRKIYHKTYYLEYKEQIRNVQREYCSKRENKDKHNERCRAYYKANKEAIKKRRLEKIAISRQTQESAPSTSAISP